MANQLESLSIMMPHGQLPNAQLGKWQLAHSVHFIEAVSNSWNLL